jgi:sarcosine oxidase, subunit beta
MASTRVLILGAGAVGLCTAYRLAQRHIGDITVVERDHVGAGASGRAAGIITGQLWSPTGVAVRVLSLAGFRQFSEELEGYSFGDVGCLNVFHEEGIDERRQHYALYDQHGVHHEELTSAQITHRWPDVALRPGLMGLLDADGGYSEPDHMLPAVAAGCRDLGVEIREQCIVTGLRQQGGRTTGVDTVTGPLEADIVVCTTHVWSRALLRQHGHALPIKAFRHQRFVTSSIDPAPALPAINAHPYGGYLRPTADGAVLVGVETPDVVEVDITEPVFHMDQLRIGDDTRQAARQVLQLLPDVALDAWADERVGALCFSADGEPILGQLGDGTYVATAFHSGGFAYSPAAGQLLAEWIATGAPSVDLTAFAPDRFAAASTEQFHARRMTHAQYNEYSAIDAPRKF